ncbi:MAG: glycosyltransferase [Deltaproteobacteria bacterium]|nr:glycosyltransferase [Deltaproteobacteria bacterium]
MPGTSHADHPSTGRPLAAGPAGATSAPPLRIAPDTYSRNWWIARACGAVFGPDAAFSSLDVGGCGGMLGEFLGRVRVVDLRAGADVDVVGDARRLPFPDGAFDVVCCSDVLEHVPEGDRGAVLAELFRVARRLVITAGPYRSEDVELAEQALREFHRYCTNGISHHWLDEHMRYGLPPVDWLEGELARAGQGTFHRLGSNNLHNWLLFQLLIFLNMFDLDAQVGDFFEDYNRHLDAYGDAGAVPYRQIHIVPVAPLEPMARAALDALVLENAGADRAAGSRGDGAAPTAFFPSPGLVGRAFTAVAEGMAVKNARIEAALAAAARNAVLPGDAAVGGSPRTAKGEAQPTLEEALARCAELEERLCLAQETLDGHESFIHQQHRQLDDVQSTMDAILRSKSWKLTAPLRSLIDSARTLSDVSRRMTGREPRRRPPTGPAGETHKAVLFLSGCPGDAKRYRCDHQAEQLGYLGVAADVAIYGEVDLSWAVRSYAYFVLHRVPFGPDVDFFICEARRAARTVIFDTDDWVFDVASIPHVAALEAMRTEERELYRAGLERYRATILRCDGAIVSTEPLAHRIGALLQRVFVQPNVASREMTRLAARARRLREVRAATGRAARDVTFAYLSGTPTHKRDFAEAESSLAWVMDRYPSVRLLTVGHIDVRETFGRFGARHSHVPLMPWQRLFEVMSEVDVNLAPLERRNPFTECKSSIKHLEAALVGVPTIATPLADFQRVIESERNGCLADSKEAWRDALRQLVESPSLREGIGQRALEDALAHHTTASVAGDLFAKLKALRSRGETDRPLTINWVVRAPIAGTGGGYWTIFRLANALGRAGHRVRVHVEAIAHLEGRSREEILAFVAENFGPLHVEVEIGHDHILPADVSIATNWPTAYTVALLPGSLFKFYFVQDFEPDFYSEDDPLYGKAAATYDLPLQIVTIGRSLARRMEGYANRPTASIDFAVDGEVFHVTTPPEARTGPTRILFFARPSLPRRAYGLGLAALRQLTRERPEVRIAFFGATDEELGEVDFAIENLGVLSHAELAREMNASHVLLCFSMSANISWVPFQGMACGCAVVDADVPGVREMIADGETCRLARPDPDGVAEALRGLVDDDAERLRLARAGAAEMQRGGWDASARQFERILTDHAFVRLDRAQRAFSRALARGA